MRAGKSWVPFCTELSKMRSASLTRVGGGAGNQNGLSLRRRAGEYEGWSVTSTAAIPFCSKPLLIAFSRGPLWVETQSRCSSAAPQNFAPGAFGA